jgi:hypothetical protein
MSVGEASDVQLQDLVSSSSLQVRLPLQELELQTQGRAADVLDAATAIAFDASHAG